MCNVLAEVVLHRIFHDVVPPKKKTIKSLTSKEAMKGRLMGAFNSSSYQ